MWEGSEVNSYWHSLHSCWHSLCGIIHTHCAPPSCPVCWSVGDKEQSQSGHFHPIVCESQRYITVLFSSIVSILFPTKPSVTWVMCYWCQNEIFLQKDYFTQMISERVHPAADGNRYRDPLPNNNSSSGNFVEQGKKGLRELEGSRTPKEDLQSKLIWAHGGSQRWNHQLKSMHGLDLSPLHLCCRCLSWSSCGSPNNQSGGCLWLCCRPLTSFPLDGLPCLASVRDDTLSPATAWGARVGCHPLKSSLSFPEKKEREE